MELKQIGPKTFCIEHGVEGIAAAGIGMVITVRCSIIYFERAIETARANKEKYEEETPEEK